MTDYLTLVLQGLNLTDEPTFVRHIPTSPNAAQPFGNIGNFTEVGGRKWFFGVRFRV